MGPPSADLRAPSTPSRLRSMLCSAPPRTLRRSPRRRWLTPPVLLMSSVLSRTTPLPRHLLKGSLNNQLGQLEGRLADAENAAAKGGKAAMSKLENKIRELEAELAGTQARTGEAGKAYQRAERKCKELVFSSGEDKKNQDRMTDLASKLQSKIKTYKQQIEEAEEIAALNLAKFRKAQQELEEVEERAKLAALL